MSRLFEVQPLEPPFAPQGPHCPYILVDQDAMAGDEDLVYAVVCFVNDVQSVARLSPGEYPEEASWSYCADYYLAQVNNGGHGQYAHNSRLMARTLRDCRRGLATMGADDYLAIFDAFIAIMERGDARAQAIAEGGGFGDIDPEISDLDSRFFALGDMTQKNAAWLRTLDCLRPMPAQDLSAALEAARARNPMFSAREDAAKAAKDKHEREDPTYRAAHALAGREGATFQHLTAGTPIGPQGEVGCLWGAATSAGFRYLRVIYDDHASWRDDKGALKGLHFYATEGPYPVPVGDGLRRREILSRASGRAITAEELADFYFRPLLDAGLQLATTPKDAEALLLGVMAGKSLQNTDYAVWRGFKGGGAHATMRLLLAYSFWDLSIAHIMRKRPQALSSDYKAIAAMAAAGAIAMAGAAAVRVPHGRQIAALKDRAPEDYAREQQNFTLQMHEVIEWRRAALNALADDLEKAEIGAKAWLRPSALRLAETLLAKTLSPPGEDLARRLAYFDAEYKGVAQLERADPAKIIGSTLSLARTQNMEGVLLHAARAFERFEQRTFSDNVRPLLRICTPAQVKAKSRARLIGVLSLIDAVFSTSKGAVGVEFDGRGRRRQIKS